MLLYWKLLACVITSALARNETDNFEPANVTEIVPEPWLDLELPIKMKKDEEIMYQRLMHYSNSSLSPEFLKEWQSNFTANMAQLQNVVPFANSTQGLFKQSFRGKWSAQTVTQVEEDLENSIGSKIFENNTEILNSTAFKVVQTAYEKFVNPQVIQETFEDIQGWANLDFNLQYYDINKQAFEPPLNASDLNSTSANQTIAPVNNVFRSEEVGNLTLVGLLTISVELYDSDYWDHSVVIEFSQMIDGLTQSLDFVNDERRILFSSSNFTILYKEYLNVVSSKNCQLEASIGARELTLREVQDLQSKPKTSESNKTLTLTIANTDFTYIGGSDQKLNDMKRFFALDLVISTLEESVQEHEACFPPKIQAKFSNTKSNDWIERFKGYSTFYLIVSISAAISIGFQYSEMRKTLKTRGVVVLNHVAIIPLILITAWSACCFIFNVVMVLSLLSDQLLAQIWTLLTLAVIVALNSAMVALVINSRHLNKQRTLHYDYVIYLLTIFFVFFGSKILTNWYMLVPIFYLMWLPQIVKTYRAPANLRFHYSHHFLFLQTLHFLFMPLYMRGLRTNFFSLRPDGYTVRTLVSNTIIQLLMLAIMRHLFDFTLYLRLIHRSKLRYCIPRRLRRFFRKLILRKLQRQHQEAWLATCSQTPKEGVEPDMQHRFFLYFRSFKRLTTPIFMKVQAESPPEVSVASAKPCRQEIIVMKETSIVRFESAGSQLQGTIDSPKAEEMTCSICMSCLKYESAELNLDGSFKYPEELVRCRGYFETPCGHTFHDECLTKWLDIRLVCPHCRSDLPPLQLYDGAEASLESDEDDDQQALSIDTDPSHVDFEQCNPPQAQNRHRSSSVSVKSCQKTTRMDNKPVIAWETPVVLLTEPNDSNQF